MGMDGGRRWTKRGIIHGVGWQRRCHVEKRMGWDVKAK